MKIIVREPSAVVRALRWLKVGVPKAVGDLLAGPRSEIVLPAAADGRIPSGKLKLLLGPELLLACRYTLPVAAKSHLSHAVALFIETATPFTRHEVLVHAERLDATDATEAAYQLRILPVAALSAATTSAGIDHRQVVGIVDATAPERTNFWTIAFPVRSARRWLALVPVAIALACGGFVATSSRLQDEQQIVALTEATESRLSELKRLDERLSERRAEAALNAELAALLSGHPSVHNMLQQMRRKLPADAVVARIVIADGDVVLTVRSPQVLSVAERLDSEGQAELEGAITTDAVTGLEQASIRVGSASERKP